MSLTSLVSAVLEAGADDWVGLWELPYLARTIGGAESEGHERVMCLDAIRVLLKEHRAEIGDVTTEGGFVAWPMDGEAIIQRIASEWDALNGHPRMGDIGWIRTP